MCCSCYWFTNSCSSCSANSTCTVYDYVSRVTTCDSNDYPLSCCCDVSSRKRYSVSDSETLSRGVLVSYVVCCIVSSYNSVVGDQFRSNIWDLLIDHWSHWYDSINYWKTVFWSRNVCVDCAITICTSFGCPLILVRNYFVNSCQDSVLSDIEPF